VTAIPANVIRVRGADACSSGRIDGSAGSESRARSLPGAQTRAGGFFRGEDRWPLPGSRTQRSSARDLP